MNLFLTTAGYPWTIVRTERRSAYLVALESASTQGNIEPFARFILEEMQVDWRKEPAARKARR
ncbi:MAG: cell filamentation protein Fic, partial [Kiritimatiellaeota bacterium]|nr:cell filamentation protein Fic [Kiritimatiellota bacterium]